MQNDDQEVEVQEDDLDTTSDVVEVEEDDSAQDAEYWKAEALKNKAILDRAKTKKETKTKQSDEFDYGEYAYLSQKGIESDADIKFVQDSMKDSGKSLRDTLNANWFKSDLAERQALAATATAVPTGKNANSTATDSVEYWSAKPIAEVPADMRAQVVNAKIAKERDVGKFYNS